MKENAQKKQVVLPLFYETIMWNSYSSGRFSNARLNNTTVRQFYPCFSAKNNSIYSWGTNRVNRVHYLHQVNKVSFQFAVDGITAAEFSVDVCKLLYNSSKTLLWNWSKKAITQL